MALSYHFTLSAPASTSPTELGDFLRKVETSAKIMRFRPTMVLSADFDSAERMEFARRLTTGLFIEDSRLSGIVSPAPDQLWSHDPVSGSCRVMPKQAAVLIVTDEQGCECFFGFFRYPEEIVNVHGKIIAKTGLAERWIQRDFVDSPDPRYRRIIRLFADSGFLESEKDEYA